MTDPKYDTHEALGDRESAAAPTTQHTDHDHVTRALQMQVDSNELDKSYHAATIVNGTEIIVEWSSDHQGYEIYFPQIEPGEEAVEKGVNDQVLRLSRRSEVAKQVFDHVAEFSKTESDVYKIYLEALRFSKDFPYDEDRVEK